MIPVPELKFGFNDAINYRRRENKEMFNKFFIRTQDLDNLCESNVFFLIGEKGTGKTAYAAYISNNEYKGNAGIIKDVKETDYLKFIKLKINHHLQLSDYSEIWSVIIYLILAQQIIEKESERVSIRNHWKFKVVQRAIDDFYSDAFSPEIINAIRFVESAKDTAHLIHKNILFEGKIGLEENRTVTSDKSKFQMNLYYIRRKFEEGIGSLNLNKNHILFIDGIDVRPPDVPFNEYLDCVKGLADAVWSINNVFFPSIRDSNGRLRVVLLLRPDIFDKLGLQNQGNKLRDNSVLLDWRTKYTFYRKSPIFEVADNILKAQQPKQEKDYLQLGDTWDYYFPYDASNVTETHAEHTAFIEFLRYSLYRPRDIVTMLKILKTVFENKGKNPNDVFSNDDFKNPDFQDQLSEYYMSEIKDELLFHYSEEEYRIFHMFFKYLKGSTQFSYSRYKAAFDLYHDSIRKYEIPVFCEDADTFLQFLYNLNIICYVETTYTGKKSKWCFRERSYGNISPKVKVDAEYFMHYGMLKAFNIGEQILK